MTGEFVSAFSVLFIMLGLLGLLAWMVKRFGLLPGQPRIGGKDKQLEILDSQMLDTRNRLVVVRWRGKDYFIGTGQTSVTLIDSAAEGGAPDMTPADKTDFKSMLRGQPGD